MELWIRNQDKERLIKVENLYIEFNGDTNPKVDSHRIVTDKFINLGIYKSKERALEVLDDIEQLLMFTQGTGFSDFNGNALYNVNNNLAVYEMPKE